MPSSPSQRVVIVGGELFWQCDACKRRATWFWNTERLRLRFCDRHKPFPAPVSHSAPEIPERLKEKATEEVYVRNRRKYSDLTEEDVARWAQLRREGRSQLWIQKNDALGPSPPTLNKYLAEYGYDVDGYEIEEEAEAEQEPSAEEEQTLASVEETGLAVVGDGRDAESQLQAVQKLVGIIANASGQEAGAKVQGKIRVDLSIEVEVGDLEGARQ